MPVILTAQEVEIRRHTVQGQPWSNSLQDPLSKNLNTKKRLVEWLKVEALSSSPSTTKKKSRRR
jgi:hypothetical protein